MENTGGTRKKKPHGKPHRKPHGKPQGKNQGKAQGGVQAKAAADGGLDCVDLDGPTEVLRALHVVALQGNKWVSFIELFLTFHLHRKDVTSLVDCGMMVRKLEGGKELFIFSPRLVCSFRGILMNKFLALGALPSQPLKDVAQPLLFL